jgi:hypothetical protein
LNAELTSFQISSELFIEHNMPAGEEDKSPVGEADKNLNYHICLSKTRKKPREVLNKTVDDVCLNN